MSSTAATAWPAARCWMRPRKGAPQRGRCRECTPAYVCGCSARFCEEGSWCPARITRCADAALGQLCGACRCRGTAPATNGVGSPCIWSRSCLHGNVQQHALLLYVLPGAERGGGHAWRNAVPHTSGGLRAGTPHHQGSPPALSSKRLWLPSPACLGSWHQRCCCCLWAATSAGHRLCPPPPPNARACALFCPSAGPGRRRDAGHPHRQHSLQRGGGWQHVPPRRAGHPVHANLPSLAELPVRSAVPRRA